MRVGDTREEYAEVFGVYWPIGVGIFALIVVLVVFVVLRFRSSSPEFPKGRDHSRAEEVYAVVVGLVVALLLYVTYTAMDDIAVDQTASGSSGRPQGAELVSVTATRWRWRFDYPDHSVTEVGTDDRSPTLAVPAGTPVYFRQTSLDVVHSFWIPERRFKMDAFPGRTTTFTLVFPDEGHWRGGGECAQYCGWRHQDMEFDVRVLSRDGFERWLEARS